MSGYERRNKKVFRRCLKTESDGAEGGMSSNHFITNFPQNVPVKKILRIGQYSTQIWTKLCGLLFWATLYIFAFYHAPSVNVKGDLRNIALLPRVRSHFATYWSDDNYRV